MFTDHQKHITPHIGKRKDCLNLFACSMELFNSVLPRRYTLNNQTISSFIAHQPDPNRVKSLTLENIEYRNLVEFFRSVEWGKYPIPKVSVTLDANDMNDFFNMISNPNYAKCLHTIKLNTANEEYITTLEGKLSELKGLTLIDMESYHELSDGVSDLGWEAISVYGIDFRYPLTGGPNGGFPPLVRLPQISEIPHFDFRPISSDRVDQLISRLSQNHASDTPCEFLGHSVNMLSSITLANFSDEQLKVLADHINQFSCLRLIDISPMFEYHPTDHFNLTDGMIDFIRTVRGQKPEVFIVPDINLGNKALDDHGLDHGSPEASSSAMVRR